MMVRVPNFIANIREMLTKIFQKSFDIMEHHDAEFREGCFKRGVPKQVLESDSMSVVATRDAALTFSLAAAEIPIKIFARMHWTFLHGPTDSPFFTGDNPVFYCNPEHRPGSLFGVGLGNKTIEVTYPLSRGVCAFATWEGCEAYHQKVSTDVVDRVNSRTVHAALRFVYGPEKCDRIMDLVRVTKGTLAASRIEKMRGSRRSCEKVVA